MKHILMIISILFLIFSCGSKKDDWDGPNGYGPLDGRFEIHESSCSMGATPVQSRVLNFLPHDNGTMYVDFIKTSAVGSIYTGRSAECSYSRPSEREFRVTISMDATTFKINGGFNTEDDFEGDWTETCNGSEITCRITGNRLE